MEIVGEKVVLRTVESQDQEMLKDLMDDPDITKITGGYKRTNVLPRYIDSSHFLTDSGGNVCRVIADKECPRLGLGIIMLTHINRGEKQAEIQIKLKKSVRGRGYGQDAVRLLVSYAFLELQLDGIASNILESNQASRRLFEKCGFTQKSVYKGRVHKDGHCSNICLYELRKENSFKAHKFMV